MTPHPTELRVRVVAAVEEGVLSIPEAARIFQVGLPFIKKMLKLHRAGESLEPRHGCGPVPLLREPETTVLRQELKVRPDATLEELQHVLTVQCRTTASLSTLSRGLHALHSRGKKSLIASERDEKARTRFRQFTNSLASERFVSIAEMGSHLGLTRLYG
jgi:transposase